jgi:hypothetical protein
VYDQPGEGTGWGIFGYNENPYDGRDYRIVQPDPITPGRTTLTEDRVYGDAITPIKSARIAEFTTLQIHFGTLLLNRDIPSSRRCLSGLLLRSSAGRAEEHARLKTSSKWTYREAGDSTEASARSLYLRHVLQGSKRDG